jgi:hypothetical protein
MFHPSIGLNFHVFLIFFTTSYICLFAHTTKTITLICLWYLGYLRYVCTYYRYLLASQVLNTYLLGAKYLPFKYLPILGARYLPTY